MSECEEIANTINRLVEAGHIAKAQELLELALDDYFVLQLAMFANTKVNAYVTIGTWKQAGLRLPAEDTDEFYPYRDSPSVTKEQLKAEVDKLKEERRKSVMASEPEQIAGGYWRAVAEHFISAQLNKPFFGRPHLKLGQCFGLWGYLFELGGLLGAKHRAKLDAFMPAFMGTSGEAGAAERFLVAVANNLLDQHSLNSMKHWAFVGADLGHRVSYYKRDDWSDLLMERGTDKIPPDVAAKNAWFYARDGAALGAISSDVMRAMFERTHAPVSKEEWQEVYAAGVDIGPEPPALRSYEESKDEENKNFMEYCREFCPDLYSVLKEPEALTPEGSNSWISTFRSTVTLRPDGGSPKLRSTSISFASPSDKPLLRHRTRWRMQSTCAFETGDARLRSAPAQRSSRRRSDLRCARIVFDWQTVRRWTIRPACFCAHIRPQSRSSIESNNTAPRDIAHRITPAICQLPPKPASDNSLLNSSVPTSRRNLLSSPLDISDIGFLGFSFTVCGPHYLESARKLG